MNMPNCKTQAKLHLMKSNVQVYLAQVQIKEASSLIKKMKIKLAA